jgi:hypothetical protein
MSAPLTQLERTATKILADLRKLELIDVASAARLLKTSPKFVRAHLPIVLVSERGQRVRVSDIEAFQARRTVWPKNGAT